LRDPICTEGYLQFPPENGREEARAIHELLYRWLPRHLLSVDHPYAPHITFGRLRDGQSASLILAEASGVLPIRDGVIGTLVLERIGTGDESFVEYEKQLRIMN
jgi:hypothetical protein